ncbi:uncharacterized protein EDB93DRAFT_1218287 [Suillus bovinus]|uniref:uncharacterized protein n=1 Tax=Suillus bovinus TaxID=48563 RepID=UPI001B87A46C|nr:uncharacterized protein EDB93DRAFT_1218287 [Suillus bovinus]KAG2159538.1 hypothetical protein EDB93DRAFT_1218287 [Suillus bovinus]
MRLLVFFFIFLEFLAGVIQAAPTTNTTNTTTSDNVEAPSFTTRTLWTIISSSILTLFACVYSAIHPNIPSHKDSGYPHIIWRQLSMIIMALIAPELIVTWAMRQRFSADQWTQTHSFFVLMGGFMLYVDGEPYCTLQPNHILKLIHEKCIDVPTLTAKQIHDKSKGNAISKGVVVLQVAWFVIQLITRAIYHLETTQLEVGTLAFAVLNFLTYAAWWDKPLDVQCPYPVHWKSTGSKATVTPEYYIDEKYEITQFGPLSPFFRPILELVGYPGIPACCKLQVPTFDGSIKLVSYSDKIALLLAGLLMATIFGGIHAMAWFFVFPTYQEQVLWRMSAVAITCTPWFGLLTTALLAAMNAPLKLFILLYALCTLFYIIARAVLLVLMFTTLRNLPPDAYKALLWTSLVPHL